MTRQDQVKQLQKEFGYWPSIALAIVEERGRCQYCKEDLLACRPGFSSMEVDHSVKGVGSCLLPIRHVHRCAPRGKTQGLTLKVKRKRGRSHFPRGRNWAVAVKKCDSDLFRYSTKVGDGAWAMMNE